MAESRDAGLRLCEALGLVPVDVRRLDIIAVGGEPVRVTVESIDKDETGSIRIIGEGDERQIAMILKDYTLVEVAP